MGPLIEFKNVSKSYSIDGNKFFAVKDISFEIDSEELVVIMGPSGAGKSTLLNLLGGMTAPSAGEIIVSGQKINAFTEKQLTQYRCISVGFVFQFYNLIPTLTAYENVALIKDIIKNAISAEEVLGLVGLTDHKDQFPAQLSGGEQQRVSIARALAKNSDIILCDEPTGALDTKSGEKVLGLLCSLVRDENKTVIIVTHNEDIAKMADKIIRIKDGEIEKIPTDIQTQPLRKEPRLPQKPSLPKGTHLPLESGVPLEMRAQWDIYCNFREWCKHQETYALAIAATPDVLTEVPQLASELSFPVIPNPPSVPDSRRRIFCRLSGWCIYQRFSDQASKTLYT